MSDTKASIPADEETKASHNLLDEEILDKRTHENEPHKRERSCSCLLSKRWIVAYMGLFYGAISYVCRVNISIALPFMVKTRSPEMELTDWISNGTYHSYNLSLMMNQSTEQNSKISDVCPEVSASLRESVNAEFTWSKQAQSFVLSGFYYGYLFQVPFGWLAGQYGGKHIISISMAISSALMLLFPVLARTSVYAIIAARVLLGVCSGATMPAWYKLVSQWALPTERSRFNAFCWVGQYIGTILGFFTSGFLCANGFDNGWGSVFYVDGTVGVIFVLLWLYLVHNSPAEHQGISRAELKLLTSQATGVDAGTQKRQVSVPWRQMLTYRPVWAVIVTHFLETYLFYMVLTCLPLYMKAVLRFDIQSNGIFSSLPFVCSAVSLSLSGILADTLISRHCLTTTTTRKLLQNTGFVGAAAFILVIGFLTCEQHMWVIVLLCLCMFFDGLGLGAGFTCTAVDMAPRYASVIFGMSNTAGTLGGVIAPLIVTEITPNDTAEEWRTVFCIATGCGLTAAVVFGLFSSSELAPWAGEKPIELDVYCEKSSHFSVENGEVSINLVDQEKEAIT